MIAELIILLVISGAIYALGRYLLPDPAKNIASIVAIVIAVIALLNFLLIALGHSALIPLHIN